MSRISLVLGLVALLAGCRSSAPVPAGQPTVGFTAVDGGVAPDSALVRLVEPYARSLQAEMAQVVATAPAVLTKDGAESLLGNLSADAMLAEAERMLGRDLDFSVGNAGGLRKPIGPGEITRGDVFELMPFENFLIVVTLTGEEVDSLAQQIAAVGGEPVSGIAFTIGPDGRAEDVRIDGQPLERAARYEVVSHNYLVYGGGEMPALWSPQASEDVGLTLRDAFLAHFARLGTLSPALEGRITLREP